MTRARRQAIRAVSELRPVKPAHLVELSEARRHLSRALKLLKHPPVDWARARAELSYVLAATPELRAIYDSWKEPGAFDGR